MVVAKFDGLVDCCENGSGLEQVVFDSAFCEVEVVNLGLLFRLGLALVSILEVVGKSVCVLAVLLVEFHLVWVRTFDQMRMCRGNFSIDVALVGRE